MSKHRNGGESGSGLGRTLIKEKRRERKSKKQTEGWLHTSELNDGYNWGRLNLASVTEESSIDDFLRTAELAGTEFTAEKLNVQVVVPQQYTGLLTVEERREIKQAQEDNRHHLSIPRRPAWDKTTTTEQLELQERESFLEWRRSLVQLQENERLTLTPFERNLEFWRQLWRVIERSDVVVQIVDARNPLLFRCEDLERYVLEHHSGKKNMILMSKADLLTAHQRAVWADYFHTACHVEVAFWSSHSEDNKQQCINLPQQSSDGGDGAAGSSEDGKAVGASQGDDYESNNLDAEGVSGDGHLEIDGLHGLEFPQTLCSGHQEVSDGGSDEEVSDGGSDEEVSDGGSDEEVCDSGSDEEGSIGKIAKTGGNGVDSFPGVGVAEEVWSPVILSKSKLLCAEDLLEVFKKLGGDQASPITIGLVGYPNVGKSSTINTLLRQKKVPVSATPGRTKHFQTLYVSPDLLLCDCPGLVFPTFVNTKAELICNGVLPIDQMRDHLSPVALICQNIPRRFLEQTYGLRLPIPGEGEEGDRPPYAHELLAAYGYVRGFMTGHGQPDQARSARYILKDYVSGRRLLYCHPPPGLDPVAFNTQLQICPAPGRPGNSGTCRVEGEQDHPKPPTPPTSKFDHTYFQKGRGQVHTKRVSGFAVIADIGSKKHGKGHKKEKLRRIVGATPYN